MHGVYWNSPHFSSTPFPLLAHLVVEVLVKGKIVSTEQWIYIHAVSVSDSQSSGSGFKSHSDHYVDLFLGSPEFKSSATLVNSQLVCLRPVGILSNVRVMLNYLF